MTLVPERLRLFLSGSKTSTDPHNVLVPVTTTPRTCGQLGCYLGRSATVGLGHRKSDSESKLKLLHKGGWLSRQTAAVKVQFTLFSPAPNLFTGVTMLAEQSPMGVLLPSARVQSVRVYYTPAAWDYVVMVCQLLFLFLSLLQLCDQVYSVGQQGLMGYWRTPCTWLEVSVLIVTLVYYVYYIYHSVIILDVLELLQGYNYRGHVDISLLAAWEQCIRTLRGVLLFLLIMKCVTVLTLIRTLATSATLLTRSLSRLFWPMVSGLILMVVLSCVGNLLFVQSSRAFSALAHSPQTLLCHHWGRRAVRSLLLSGRDLLYHGIFHLFSTVWAALAIIVMSSLVRGAKASKSTNNVFTVAELAGYIRQRVSEFTGLARRHAWIENQVERRAYHLEEFESLVDELMFKLNVLSDSLPHTLPPKAHRYREEDSPVPSLTQEPSQIDAQDFVRALLTEETRANDHTNVSGHGETLSPLHLIRPKLDVETLQLLQQRSQRGDNTFDIVVEPDYFQQRETRAEGNPKNAELSTFFKAQHCLSLPESALLIQVCTENVLEKQSDQRTETNDLCWLSETQATHTEVLVEVLVHREPGNVLPDTQ
uniref:polycystin-1-like protein 1 n=1 Tax=Semicossyphus pulcher TaxID=241346 RepID=UPI0037E90AE3